jgi:hypothetical protein
MVDIVSPSTFPCVRCKKVSVGKFAAISLGDYDHVPQRNSQKLQAVSMNDNIAAVRRKQQP